MVKNMHDPYQHLVGIELSPKEHDTVTSTQKDASRSTLAYEPILSSTRPATMKTNAL